jgi:hypothetical protein
MGSLFGRIHEQWMIQSAQRERERNRTAASCPTAAAATIRELWKTSANGENKSKPTKTGSTLASRNGMRGG